MIREWFARPRDQEFRHENNAGRSNSVIPSSRLPAGPKPTFVVYYVEAVSSHYGAGERHFLTYRTTVSAHPCGPRVRCPFVRFMCLLPALNVGCGHLSERSVKVFCTHRQRKRWTPNPEQRGGLTFCPELVSNTDLVRGRTILRTAFSSRNSATWAAARIDAHWICGAVDSKELYTIGSTSERMSAFGLFAISTSMFSSRVTVAWQIHEKQEMARYIV